MCLNVVLNQGLDLLKNLFSASLLFVSRLKLYICSSPHTTGPALGLSDSDNCWDLGDQTCTFPLVAVVCLCGTQGELEVKVLRQERSKVCMVCLAIFGVKLLFSVVWPLACGK